MAAINQLNPPLDQQGEMPPKSYKFHLLTGLGSRVNNSSLEDLFFNWAVVHTCCMLSAEAPIKNFIRYAQNYLNPDVPNEARLVDVHPTIRYYTFADHWCNEWENVVDSVINPDHANKLGRHHFGDANITKVFFGKGAPVYRSRDFAHPAEVTVGHFLSTKAAMTLDAFLEDLYVHRDLLVSKLLEFGKPVKYTLDVCDSAMAEQVQTSPLAMFPCRDYVAVEFLHFGRKQDAFDFTDRYGKELRASYSRFIDLKTSHSVYGTERIVLDFTDENPSTKTPLPVYFTDKNSLEYKMMHNDFAQPAKSYDLLEGTKWSSYATKIDREDENGTKKSKTLDHESKWEEN